MPDRFVSIWFRYLLTDNYAIEHPEVKGKLFVLAEMQRGRKVITAITAEARKYGVKIGMTVADARIITPELAVFDGSPGRNEILLREIAEWCLRFSPVIAMDLPEGLLLNVSGCTHLLGGELPYLKEMANRLKELGYTVRPAIADTIGCAWGVARCAPSGLIVVEGGHRNALMPLPPAALRLPEDLLVKLHHLGLYTIASFIHFPKGVLKRRFGKDIVLRLYQALGQEEEFLIPLKEPAPYSDRESFLEPIRTRSAIEIGLRMVLDRLCKRLHSEGRGLREVVLSYYRIDGKIAEIRIGTNHATHRSDHLFKLFSLKLDQVAPGLGIELFVLDAVATDPVSDKQADLWAAGPGADSEQVAELLDRVAGRVGPEHILRYLPAEHFWPERTAEPNGELKKQPQTAWRIDKPRPLQMINPPESVVAIAATPDYPPKQFIYRGKSHVIIGSDGPERIEREWWMDEGEHRDYYIVEDENGGRYWLFRSGHYDPEQPQHWFIHGVFA